MLYPPPPEEWEEDEEEGNRGCQVGWLPIVVGAAVVGRVVPLEGEDWKSDHNVSPPPPCTCGCKGSEVEGVVVGSKGEEKEEVKGGVVVVGFGMIGLDIIGVG